MVLNSFGIPRSLGPEGLGGRGGLGGHNARPQTLCWE